MKDKVQLNTELVNRRSLQLLNQSEKKLAPSELKKNRIGNATIWDFGVEVEGSLESGKILATISSGGGLKVGILNSLQTDKTKLCQSFPESSIHTYLEEIHKPFDRPITFVQVTSQQPLVDCMACQYAGWPLSTDKYFAMVSGPGRGIRGKEKLFSEFQLEEANQSVAVLILESSQLPDEEVIRKIEEELGWTDAIKGKDLHLCVAPTSSVAGSIQVVARSLETALHKLHSIDGPIASISAGSGISPIPPKAENDLTAIGWTNDAIINAGFVSLFLESDTPILHLPEEMEILFSKVPSASSPSYGKSFLTLFEEADRDFYQMDPALFAPAAIHLQWEQEHQTQSKILGNWNPELLASCWKTSS